MTQETELQAADGNDFIEIEVYGRHIPRQTVRVYELMTGELADCTDELMAIGATLYANKEAVLKLLKDTEQTGVTVEQIAAAFDVKTVTRQTTGALVAMIAKSIEKEPEFVRGVHPLSFVSLATAALAKNESFFSTLLALIAEAGQALNGTVEAK